MASTRKQRRGLAGVTPLRRKLREMHKRTENTIRPIIEDAAASILWDMRSLTPVDTGNLVREMDVRISRDGMTAYIGLVTPADARDAFYFAFLDTGTKGDPKRNIPPMPALHIRQRAFDANKAEYLARLKRAIDATLARVATSG